MMSITLEGQFFGFHLKGKIYDETIWCLFLFCHHPFDASGDKGGHIGQDARKCQPPGQGDIFLLPNRIKLLLVLP